MINLDRDPPAIETGIPFYRLDVTSEEDVVAVAQLIACDHGGVDIRVNNVAIARIGPSMSFPLKGWDASFAASSTFRRSMGSPMSRRGSRITRPRRP